MHFATRAETAELEIPTPSFVVNSWWQLGGLRETPEKGENLCHLQVIPVTYTSLR